jgi:polynucleotide 5'-hydroxyl-kinase GRC3/NOL9
MQYMSYFHLESTNTNEQIWNANSVTSLVPWDVKYGGKNAGILGILCIGEQPPISMLKNTLDGTVLAIVVLDDNAAIRSSRNRRLDPRDNSGLSGEGDHGDGVNNSDLPLQDDGKLERSFTIQTPEGIPYFDPARVTTLDPRYSQTIGLALVRGIDSERQRLQLLTPVAGSILKGLRASQKEIVLVSGKLDTPGWAYTEDFYKRAATRKRRNNVQVAGVSDYEEDESGDDERNDEQLDEREEESPERVPWTERLYGDEGRGTGARVWRVRRDLGRAGVGD